MASFAETQHHERFGEVFLEAELPGQRAGNLRNFQRMGQPGSVMVALVEHEHLRLVLEAAERGRVDDAVGIAAERRSSRARRLRIEPAAACRRIGRIGARVHEKSRD